jgi:hypothetical protein
MSTRHSHIGIHVSIRHLRVWTNTSTRYSHIGIHVAVRHSRVWNNTSAKHSHIWIHVPTRHSHISTNMSTRLSHCFSCTFSVGLELLRINYLKSHFRRHTNYLPLTVYLRQVPGLRGTNMM